MRFINIYMVHRCYGGPEEGGWWFDAGEAIRSIPIPMRHVSQVMGRVRTIVDAHNEGRRELSSVLSDGRYYATIEKKPAQDWPREQPYYC